MIWNNWTRFLSLQQLVFKNVPKHFLHAVQCAVSDLSQNSLRVMTKVVNRSCCGEHPEFVSKALFSASLSALLKKKGGIRPIAGKEVLWRQKAKCLVKKANSESDDCFRSLQLGVQVKGGAETNIHSTKHTYKNLLSSPISLAILQIEFFNAFIS